MSPLLLAWAIGCSSPGTDDADRAESVLDARAYRFCHVEGANAADAQTWCELLADLPPERCPGLRATCAGAVSADPRSDACEPSGQEAEPDAIAGAPQPPPDREDWKCGERPNMDGLQSLLRWIAAIGVAVLVLVVLRLVWATFGRRKPAPTKPVAVPAPLIVSVSDPSVPDAPSGDLLDAARQALASGRASEAVLLARGAVLRRLGEIGRVWLHRSRTDREYVRSVRADKAVHVELREICSAAEAVRWEGTRVEQRRATLALAAAERLFAVLAVQRSARSEGPGSTSGAVGALLALSLGAALHPSDARAQGFDYERYAPNGDAALLDVFQLYGYDAGFRLTSLSAVDERVDVVVIDTVHVQPTEEQWTHLRAWVEGGGVLLVGGEPDGFPELGTTDRPVGDIHVLPAFSAAGLPEPRWPSGPLSAFQAGTGWALVADEADAAVVEVLDLGQGAVVAIADPALLWNGAFVHPDNERFVGELIYTGQSVAGWPVGHPVRIQLATRAATASDDSSSGQSNDMVGALATSGLLLFVLQLIATGALAGASRGWPFSPLRDPPDAGRHAFVEHVRALGTRYWRLKATAHAERQFAALWLLRLGVPGLELAAQRAGYTPELARAWAKEIEAVATSTPDPGGREEGDLGRMEELWRITRTAR